MAIWLPYFWLYYGNMNLWLKRKSIEIQFQIFIILQCAWNVFRFHLTCYSGNDDCIRVNIHSLNAYNSKCMVKGVFLLLMSNVVFFLFKESFQHSSCFFLRWQFHLFFAIALFATNGIIQNSRHLSVWCNKMKRNWNKWFEAIRNAESVRGKRWEKRQNNFCIYSGHISESIMWWWKLFNFVFERKVGRERYV